MLPRLLQDLFLAGAEACLLLLLSELLRESDKAVDIERRRERVERLLLGGRETRPLDEVVALRLVALLGTLVLLGMLVLGLTPSSLSVAILLDCLLDPW